MKGIYIAFFVGLLCFGCSATLLAQVKVTIPKSIDGTKKKCHEYVEGTKISICPPKGYIVANNWQGYQHYTSGASIIVLEMPAPWGEIRQIFTAKEGLISQGIVVKKVHPIQVYGKEGFLVIGEQFANGMMHAKYILAFDTGSGTVMVNGAHPNELKEFADGMVTSLLSIVYNANEQIDAFAGVTYRIDVAGTKLKFAMMTGSVHLFTVDSKATPEVADKTALMVGNTLGYVVREDHKQTAVDHLHRMPFANIEIQTVEPITIDDISGYAITAYATNTKSGNKEMIYHVTLFSDTMYYFIIGISPNGHEENMMLFKKIAATFERK